MSLPDDNKLVAPGEPGAAPLPPSTLDETARRNPRQSLKSFGTVTYAIDLMNVVNEKARLGAREAMPPPYTARPATEGSQQGASESVPESTSTLPDAPLDTPRELRFLCDAVCRDIKQLSGGGVVFTLGTYVLTVDAAWRITGPGGVLLSRTGQQHLFSAGAPVSAVELVRALIGQSKVVAAVADDRLGDLAIAFGGGLCLEVWNDASGIDAWSLQGQANELWRATTRGIVTGSEPSPAPDE